MRQFQTTSMRMPLKIRPFSTSHATAPVLSTLPCDFKSINHNRRFRTVYEAQGVGT